MSGVADSCDRTVFPVTRCLCSVSHSSTSVCSMRSSVESRTSLCVHSVPMTERAKRSVAAADEQTGVSAEHTRLVHFVRHRCYNLYGHDASAPRRLPCPARRHRPGTRLVRHVRTSGPRHRRLSLLTPAPAVPPPSTLRGKWWPRGADCASVSRRQDSLRLIDDVPWLVLPWFCSCSLPPGYGNSFCWACACAGCISLSVAATALAACSSAALWLSMKRTVC